MKVSDYIAQLFVENNMKHIFSISGAGNIHLLNSIIDNPNLVPVHPHQEQSGVLASLAYKRICGRLGVMITTSGGAATNAITGALDAWADSIPVLIISGQEKSQFIQEHKDLRMWGVQGFDICKTVSNITKYAVLITDPKRVKYEFQKAIHIAESGRPGPSWIDIPTDILAAQINPEELEAYIPEKENTNSFSKFIPQINELLKSSKKPLFIFGNGIRLGGAEHLLNKLVDKFNVPFLTTWNGLDVISSEHPLNYGREGTYGQRCANFVVQNADLIITIGTRMAIPQVGYDLKEFGRDAKKVIVDIDPTELAKFSQDPSFILVEAHAKNFIESLLNEVNAPAKENFTDWKNTCDNWKKKYPFVEPDGLHKEQDGFLNSYQFMKELNSHFSPNEIVVTDMGTALTCTHQTLKLKDQQRIVTSTGLGEMGFGLPGAIGASLAADKQRVILLNGDGSMMMNLQEMQTIIHHKLPVKLFVYINDGYLTIKHTQNNLFGKKFSGSGADSGVSCPDFSKIGEAFGFKTFKINSLEESKTIIPKVLNEDGPVLCEVFIHSMQLLAPKTSFNINPDGTLVSPPLEDLSPFLTREELQKDMIIPVHPKSLQIKN
ncbi:MAG: acetolactate synthase isozyme 1 large subunit-like [Bacteroidetes bacterium]|jgi:acetolactate synthase-1/2/3 large subunit|nr:acetolactate synthase isozyme 1 large subunit-like [Bacteroidota bacterium]MDF2452059.1 acetolactate synthase isozyme 1 large subunit-like [Bacteroidota bacterium]